MSTIRRQSIISSVIVYIGFALGIFNTYLFTREGGLTKEQLGVTGLFIAFANIMFSVASFAMPSYIHKFFPYYKAHAEKGKNDQLAWALLLPCIGFTMVLFAGIALKPVVVDRIFNNSPEILRYYYWTFAFGFGYTIFMVLEAYAWMQGKAVLSNLLKEVVFRAIITVLIVLITVGLLPDFDRFITIYAFSYLALAVYLVFYFYSRGELPLSFSVSRVTRRFRKKIITLVSYVWGGSLIFNISNVFDTIILAAVAPNGAGAAGIFTVAQNISSLMQAPQRAIVSASVGPLSQAWKDKDMGKIQRIYQSSSINQLLFATAVFCLIWLNFDDGLRTFNIQGDYAAAKWAFFFIGIYKIIDMGSGLNSQIIGTSSFWKFEFTTGMILLALMLPLNWQLTRYLGILGPAVANLISFTVYNGIRFGFLWKKFGMQPFNSKTVYTLLLAGVGYTLCYFIFDSFSGIIWIMARSILFISIFATGMMVLQLSPDMGPVLQSIGKRLRPGS